MTLAQLRREYHQKICTQIIRIKGKGETSYPNFADGNNRSSVTIAWNIFRQLKCDKNPESLTGQETGRQFEHLTQEFITNAFNLLQHLRPGKWLYEVGKLAISSFYQ
ncbi:MAG: restriction endonuclease, partial [Chloroflexi bacterium]